MKILSALGIITLILSAKMAFASAPLFSQKISGLDLTHDKSQENPIEFVWKDSKHGSVVAFLSVNCPCSNSHQPLLEKLAQEFSKKGIRFIGVHSNANEDVEIAKTHFKNAKFSFPVIQDTGAEIADYFKAYKTPHVYIVSPKGEILFQGGVTSSRFAEKAKTPYLENALNQLLSENPKIDPEEVRVVGCEIKRPDKKEQ